MTLSLRGASEIPTQVNTRNFVIIQRKGMQLFLLQSYLWHDKRSHFPPGIICVLRISPFRSSVHSVHFVVMWWRSPEGAVIKLIFPGWNHFIPWTVLVLASSFWNSDPVLVSSWVVRDYRNAARIASCLSCDGVLGCIAPSAYQTFITWLQQTLFSAGLSSYPWYMSLVLYTMLKQQIKSRLLLISHELFLNSWCPHTRVVNLTAHLHYWKKPRFFRPTYPWDVLLKPKTVRLALFLIYYSSIFCFLCW